MNPLILIVMLPAIIIPLFLFFKRKKAKHILKQSPYLNQTEKEKPQYLEGPFSTSDKKSIIATRSSVEGPASFTPTTLCKLFAKAAERRPNKPALGIERPTPPRVGRKAAPPLPLDQWKKWTWKGYFEECKLVGRAFMALGLEPFDGVAIYGFNSPEWFMGELGCILAGGIAAGIYPSDTPDQVAFKAEYSGAVIAVVQNNKKADVFLQAILAGKLPKLRAIVVWDPPTEDPDKIKTEIPENVVVKLWSELESEANKVSPEKLQERMDAQEPGSICCYIYTSGTTGNPKAVMISHDNILWETSVINHVLTTNEIMCHKEEEERLISYLPLSHVAGMMVDIITPIYVTAELPAWMCTYFARPYDLKINSVADRLRTVKPTLFIGVPRVWQKIAEKMKSVGAKANPILQKISAFCKTQGLMHTKDCQMGGGGKYPLLYPVGELLLKQIKAKLGLDECKYGFTGAAPMDTETLEYFGSLGIEINEVYGMSECVGAITISIDKAHIWGSCGFALPGAEVKIFQTGENINEKKECPLAKDLFKPTEAEQGEICFRGRNIMAGYMANPDLGPEHEALIKKKNESAIDNEGWLHSGDKGCMDSRGMVKITGRYKDIIIGAGGENIAPVPIENNIKALCPAISNVVMIGDKRKYNVCFVTLKAVGATGDLPGGDDLDPVACSISPGVKTISAAMKDDKWIKYITNAIKDTNKNGKVCPSNAAKIQKFSILPRDFSVETEELTPTLKLKRSFVQKKHHELVERMYNSKANYVPFNES